MENHYKEFTYQDLRMINELHKSGLTYKEIAPKFGRSCNSIKSAMKRYRKNK